MSEAIEPLVIVHGGAGTVAKQRREAAVEGTRRAAAAALASLRARPWALDACVDAALVAVRELEEDPTFNAGHGACMNAQGEFELDAGIMRSRDLESGAVAAVRDLANPSELARALMERSRHTLLVGEGARRFGLEQGLGRFSREALWTEKAQTRFEAARAGEAPADNRADTVGAVVRDGRGDLCVLGSTGGVLLKLPGRVGDTPLIGAGFYAHPRLGAALATGVGEAIMQRVACFQLLSRAAAGQPLQQALEQLCAEIHELTDAAVGMIAIGPAGEAAVGHASDHMSWAIARGSELRGGLGR